MCWSLVRYVGVGENDDVQAFYYSIESENNPKDEPLVLWLTGGPGSSAFEIGGNIACFLSISTLG